MRNIVCNKTAWKFTALTLMILVTILAVAAYGFAEKATTTTPQNLVRGVFGPVESNNSWSNYSIFTLIPGSALFPITSTSTVFYLGFTAGSEAVVGNMVLYTTARGNLTITAVTPVTLGGVSNPTIDLASTSVCPVAPATATPCIVRLDPLTLTLSPTSDYYLVVYFATNTNNSSLGGTEATSVVESSLAGFYESGNESTLTVGQSIPSGSRGQPIFLMYVMND